MITTREISSNLSVRFSGHFIKSNDFRQNFKTRTVSLIVGILGKKGHNFYPYSPISRQVVFLTLFLHFRPRKLAFLSKKLSQNSFLTKQIRARFRTLVYNTPIPYFTKILNYL